MLARYPRFIWSNLEDRAKVSPITLKHELNVMNIKATFARELRAWDNLALGDFCTWPMLYEFKAKTHDQDPEELKQARKTRDGLVATKAVLQALF